MQGPQKQVSHDLPQRESVCLKAGTFWLSVNHRSELTDPTQTSFSSHPSANHGTCSEQGIHFGLIWHRLKGKPEQVRQCHQDCKSIIIKPIPVWQNLFIPLPGPCFPLECVWSSQEHSPHAKCFLPHVAPPVILFSCSTGMQLLINKTAALWVKGMITLIPRLPCWSSSDITRGLPDLPCCT